MTHLNEILDLDALQAQIEAGYIRVQRHPEKQHLCILNYAEKAQFERAWTPETLACRGLIVDETTGEVLARPFTKFFNHDEPEAPKETSGSVTVMEKVDGSLAIIYPSTGGYSVATRGSFASEQAIHATRVLRERYADFEPDEGWTYLLEIVYPENRIVVDYGSTDDLILLGAVEISTGRARTAAEVSDWPGPCAKVFSFGSYHEALMVEPEDNAEGYVIHFHDTGAKVKVKSERYKYLHRIVTGWNERTIWELLKDGKTVEDIAENLPDEFHAWANEVAGNLQDAFALLSSRVFGSYVDIVSTLPEGFERRDFALAAKDSAYRPALFSVHDENHERTNKWIWDQIRPSLQEASLV